MKKTGRNDPCPCGSGKKYKHCCFGKTISQTAIAQPAEVSIPRALESALEHHHAGRLPEAEAIYQQILGVDPNNAEALHLSGVIAHQRGINDSAVALINRAITINAAEPRYYSNLGSALGAQGKLADAVASYRQALSMNPNFADAHYNLGSLFQAHGQVDEAVACFRHAIRLDPKKYQHTQHLVSASTGDTTERPASRYIEKLFDDYANGFDTQLVQQLGYKMPKELVALLGQAVDLPVGKWDVLDLGCGTGLSGLEISPHARRLVGVDLSANMLAKAQARNIYHRLERSDLLPMMHGEKAASYDVIMAADVFEYLGRLEEIVREAKRLLRAGGFFLFSVEALEARAGEADDLEIGRDYKLNQTGRYAHSRSYLQRLADINKFDSLQLISTTLRLEGGLPLSAWAAMWRG
jgi:predicted TPR repeat methyltransferase